MTAFRHLRASQILGANTDVGKTLLSVSLARASLAAGEHTTYVKPIGTAEPGALNDADFVKRFAGPQLSSRCLFEFDEPVSPHLAAERAKAKGKGRASVTDEIFAATIRQQLVEAAVHNGGSRGAAYVESAGGVHSPVLSGSSQLTAYRPLRLPTILVASHHLGGISATVSAYESLLLHGYDVDAVLCFEEEYYRNFEYLSRLFTQRDVPFQSFSLPPAKVDDKEADVAALQAYFQADAHQEASGSVISELQRAHQRRLEEWDTAGERTLRSVWWPFVQHSHFQNAKDVMVIDSAYGDVFDVVQQDARGPLLAPVLDGSASWWSQGFGHANHEIALAAAHAAGRYGHVMFPTATHAPALKLAERVLATAGKDWAARCFFSDDGSTAIEVALKMAMRLHNKRAGRNDRRPLGVLGFEGSYHGDTIGAMDASPGNVYNERVDWYSGRGFWLDPPLVMLQQGKPSLVFDGPQWTDKPTVPSYNSLGDVYNVAHRLESDSLVEVYSQHIRSLLQKARVELGALILEPIVMGAAGMCFIDPLFQRLVVDIARADLNLPVIFDEVFSGMGRLGHYSAGPAFLGVQPDVAAYAKVLSGGLIPLSATLASDETFQAFQGTQKVDALLHGHSYTAHAVGCAVANKSLDIMQRLGIDAGLEGKWSDAFIAEVSALPVVEGCMTLGTVLAIYLKDLEGAGYESSAGAAVLKRLRHPTATSGLAPIHARPLGNVLYLITSLTTPQETVKAYEEAILAALPSSP